MVKTLKEDQLLEHLLNYLMYQLRMRSFGVVWISDPRSLESWCIKEADESTLVTDSSVSVMHHVPSDPDLDHPKGTRPNFPRYIM